MRRMRSVLVAAALALALAAPALAERDSPARAGDFWQALERLWAQIVAASGGGGTGDAGPDWDPDGLAAPPQPGTDDGDGGPDRDPNG